LNRNEILTIGLSGDRDTMHIARALLAREKYDVDHSDRGHDPLLNDVGLAGIAET
jgi:hypothetical protein